MHILPVVRVISVSSAGLLAGIFLGHRTAAPARALLNANNFVAYQQRVHRTYVKMMPSLMAVAILTAIVWLVLLDSHWKGAEFWLTGVSVVAIISVLTMTRAVNVPINNKLMTWSVDSPPSNLREIWAPWDRADLIRTFVAIGAFVIQAVVISLIVSGSRPSMP